MELLTIHNNQPELLGRVKKWLGSTQEVLLIVEDDTMIIKRSSLPSLENLVSDEKPSPMQEIVQEVKSHRRQKS